ncbi:transposable element Tcb2 transposase [Trichonephila clavipes]|nr:transposable element Tcb2 transposase [Trichonephila clavipes]
MTVPVVQLVNGLCYARFTVWVSSAVDPTRVSLLNSRHQAARLDWAREHTDWRDEHSSDFSVINWPPRSPYLNPIGYTWDVLKQGVKAHHTAPTNLTEFKAALANIGQVIHVKHFQKLVEYMPQHVAAIIMARGDPTRY